MSDNKSHNWQGNFSFFESASYDDLEHFEKYFRKRFLTRDLTFRTVYEEDHGGLTTVKAEHIIAELSDLLCDIEANILADQWCKKHIPKKAWSRYLTARRVLKSKEKKEDDYFTSGVGGDEITAVIKTTNNAKLLISNTLEDHADLFKDMGLSKAKNVEFLLTLAAETLNAFDGLTHMEIIDKAKRKLLTK